MTLSRIPIRNVYYMLAYAWDHLRPGEELDVSASQCPDTHNLLAMLLSGGVHRLATRGIDKSYQAYTEITPRLRGRVDLLASYRRMTHLSGKMRCDHDELMVDTRPNQILKATCWRLAQSKSMLSKDNRHSIRQCLKMLNDITDVKIQSKMFHRIQLHRNNRHYRLLMHVCHLLHNAFLPEQQHGDRRFRDILQEETLMHRVFESFVRRFAIRHCPDAKVSMMRISWDGEWTNDVASVLPTMLTDVSLDRPDRKTILDCKFYKSALLTRYNCHRLHSSHLYQLIAYLKNKSRDPGWGQVDGILLYPAVEHNIDLEFSLMNHDIAIRSIDLDQDWQAIHERLLDILN